MFGWSFWGNDEVGKSLLHQVEKVTIFSNVQEFFVNFAKLFCNRPDLNSFDPETLAVRELGF